MDLIQPIDERIGEDPIGDERPLVVLAEDNDDCRHVYGLILRHFGYDVAEVSSGEEAIKATRLLQPKLVLMDIGLPGIDGWEAGALLKADPETSAVPLVAFSARISSTTDLVGPCVRTRRAWCSRAAASAAGSGRAGLIGHLSACAPET